MNLTYTSSLAGKMLAAMLLLATLSGCNAATSASTSTRGDLSAAERAAVFDEVWRVVADKYYDPSFNGVDWNAVRARYRPQLDAIQSDKEFYALLNRMTGELRDGHTRVRTPEQAALRGKRQRSVVGVLVYEVEGKPVIFDVTPGSEAERLGVRPGMIVRSVQDTPVAQALALARAEVGESSTERAAKILAYLKLIAGEAGTPLKLGLTRADGSTFNIVLPRTTVSAAPEIVARELPSGAAYIRVSQFRSPASKQVKEALENFRKAQGLVLDLRANTGGDGKEGLRVAGYFFDETVPIARALTRTGKPPSAFFGLFSLPMLLEAGAKGRQIYGGPLVVLVNDATGSTSELIAAAMQEHGRAHVIGTPTAGAVLGVLDHHKLQGGGTLAVSEVALTTPAGKRLEGKGVVPNQLVPLTLRNLQTQHDAALEAAQQYLQRQRASAR
jgi:carboxyl-terminal processing protease